jgi:hypothetical protein
MATCIFLNVGNDWHTASNWSTNSVPTATDDVVFDASSDDCTISGPAV